jgi:hypothetical protein
MHKFLEIGSTEHAQVYQALRAIFLILAARTIVVKSTLGAPLEFTYLQDLPQQIRVHVGKFIEPILPL